MWKFTRIVHFLLTKYCGSSQKARKLLNQGFLMAKLKSSSVFSGIRVTRSLVLCVYLLYRCLSFCPFLLAIVLSVLLFTDFDYPLWHLQTLFQLDESRSVCGKRRSTWIPSCYYQRWKLRVNDKRFCIFSQNVLQFKNYV